MVEGSFLENRSETRGGVGPNNHFTGGGGILELCWESQFSFPERIFLKHSPRGWVFQLQDDVGFALPAWCQLNGLWLILGLLLFDCLLVNYANR